MSLELIEGTEGTYSLFVILIINEFFFLIITRNIYFLNL